MLYTLRYREGAPGVKTDLIEASTDEIAQEVGRHYCNSSISRKFITVTRAVVATEADLPRNRKVEDPIQEVKGATADSPMSPTLQGQKMVDNRQAVVAGKR